MEWQVSDLIEIHKPTPQPPCLLWSYSCDWRRVVCAWDKGHRWEFSHGERFGAGPDVGLSLLDGCFSWRVLEGTNTALKQISQNWFFNEKSNPYKTMLDTAISTVLVYFRSEKNEYEKSYFWDVVRGWSLSARGIFEKSVS